MNSLHRQVQTSGGKPSASPCQSGHYSSLADFPSGRSYWSRPTCSGVEVDAAHTCIKPLLSSACAYDTRAGREAYMQVQLNRGCGRTGQFKIEPDMVLVNVVQLDFRDQNDANGAKQRLKVSFSQM